MNCEYVENGDLSVWKIFRVTECAFQQERLCVTQCNTERHSETQCCSLIGTDKLPNTVTRVRKKHKFELNQKSTRKKSEPIKEKDSD